MTTETQTNETAMPLDVEGLVKHFGETVALDDVSLNRARGWSAWGCWTNGAGKSTLMPEHRGARDSHSGRVACSGRRRAPRRHGWRWAGCPRSWRSIAISCKENLGSFGRYYGLSGQKLDRSDCVVPALGGARGPQGELARNLSGGMKRRLNMAAGCCTGPESCCSTSRP